MARFQRGSLRREDRSNGPTWVLRFSVTKEGRRVEHTPPVGLVKDFPTEAQAREEINNQRLLDVINKPDFKRAYTFGDLADHYIEHELGDQKDAIEPKSHTTIAAYRRNLKNYILPKWRRRGALSIQPLEVEKWLKALKAKRGLQNPTLDKQRRLMSLIFRSAQRYGMIPRREECNPIGFVRCRIKSDYEAMTITPQQAWDICHGSKSRSRPLSCWLLPADSGCLNASG